MINSRGGLLRPCERGFEPEKADMKKCFTVFCLLIVGSLGCNSADSGESMGGVIPEDARMLGDLATDAGVGSQDSMMRDVDVSPDAGQSPLCDRMANYGLREAPFALADGTNHSARAVWNGSEWGVAWIAQSGDAAPSTVLFQRVTGMGVLVGEPVEIGLTTTSQVAVVATGDGYAVAYVVGRIPGDTFAGIIVRPISSSGRPAVTSIRLESTFDVQAFDFDWAQFAGGMLVYSRGRNSGGGIYSFAFDNRFGVSTPVRLADVVATSAGVVYGDGGFGVAWLQSVESGPSELMFMLLDDNGGQIDEPELLDNGAVGPIAIAYGQGTFAMAWTKSGLAPQPRPVISLMEAGGDLIGTLPIEGPSTLNLAHDIVWTGNQGFAVAWLARGENLETYAGLTRISSLGVSSYPYRIPLPDGATHRSVSLAGLYSNLGIFYTMDWDLESISFSPDSQAMLGRLTGCN